MKKLAALALTLVLAGCGGDAPVQVPGISQPLALTLHAPDDSTGAVVFTIAGGPIDSIVSQTTVVHGAIDGSRSRADVFLVGTMGNGANVATVYVPDASRGAAYVIAVKEAANAATFAQRTSGAIWITAH